MTLDITDILEFFYSAAASRIRLAIKVSGKRQEEIYPPDEKLISKITNNRRGRNNRFLIPDAVLEHQRPGCATTGLLHGLGFNSPKEVLWGADSEIDSYLPLLFKVIWDTIPSKWNVNKDRTVDKHLLLYDFIPYKKRHTINIVWRFLLQF